MKISDVVRMGSSLVSADKNVSCPRN